MAHGSGRWKEVHVAALVVLMPFIPRGAGTWVVDCAAWRGDAALQMCSIRTGRGGTREDRRRSIIYNILKSVNEFTTFEEVAR